MKSIRASARQFRVHRRDVSAASTPAVDAADVGESTLRRYVKSVRERQSFPLVDVTVPRRQPLGSKGEVDFGEAKLVLAGRRGPRRRGLRVRYVTTPQLVNEFAEAADERRLSRLVGRYGRLDLLCLDEVGYVRLDTRGSELLFQILVEREE